MFSFSSIEDNPIAVPIYLMNSQPTRVSSTHIKGTVKTFVLKGSLYFSSRMQETQHKNDIINWI